MKTKSDPADLQKKAQSIAERVCGLAEAAGFIHPFCEVKAVQNTENHFIIGASANAICVCCGNPHPCQTVSTFLITDSKSEAHAIAATVAMIEKKWESVN